MDQFKSDPLPVRPRRANRGSDYPNLRAEAKRGVRQKSWTVLCCESEALSVFEGTESVKGDLIILDDWGLAPMNGEDLRDLLEIIDDRVNQRATLITSQLPVDHWHEYLGEPTVADAVLDRLLQSAHRLELKGDSLRRHRDAHETPKLDPS